MEINILIARISRHLKFSTFQTDSLVFIMPDRLRLAVKDRINSLSNDTLEHVYDARTKLPAALVARYLFQYTLIQTISVRAKFALKCKHVL